MKKERNLFFSILIPLITISIISYGFISLYSIYLGIENSKNIKVNYAKVLSSNLIDKIERNYYERFGDVQAFAYNILTKKALKDSSQIESLIDFMNTMTNYYVLYDLMMVLDKNGNVVAVNTKDKFKNKLNTEEIFKGRNFQNEKWFTRVKYGVEDGAWYSDFLKDKDIENINNENEQGYGLAFAAPILDEKGDFLGAWYNFSSWLEITKKIRNEASMSLKAVYPDASILITDKDGKIIDSDNMLSVVNNEIIDIEKLKKDNIVEVALSKGAYIFKGNSWRLYVIIKNDNSFLSIVRQNLVLILMCLTSLLFIIYIVYRISKRISTKLVVIKNNIEKLSSGHLQVIDVTGEEEISKMAISINSLVKGLKEKSIFAEKIGNGDLQAEFKPASEEDVLGKSLLTMRENIVNNNIEERKRNWLANGISKLSDLLRSGEDVAPLCNTLLSAVINYIEAHQGAIYIVSQNSSGQKGLEMVACYAYNRKKHLTQFVEFGEGLVGQCFLEQNTILLKEIPESFTISSGMGDAQPKMMMLIPLKVNDEINGVIQIASIFKIEDYQVKFVEKIAESLASTIMAAKVNERTKRLLMESKEQAEELRSQEEEMRQNMEEISATQEEVSRKEAHYLQRISELEKKLASQT